MNAPANIFTIPDVASDLERGYRASVSIHFPNADPFTMQARCELMALRDRAAAALRVCCDDAYPILSHVSRLATLYALADRPASALLRVESACSVMIEAARMVERGVRS